MIEVAPMHNRWIGRGLWQIVRFNWPMYLRATIVAGVALIAGAVLALPVAISLLLIAGATLAISWLIASLIVSFIVYDLSRLYDWRWLRAILPTRPTNWVNLHAGFDDTSDAIGRLFPHAAGLALDMFDAREMTEPSIARARQLSRSSISSVPVNYRRLPLETGGDLILLLLAAHEIRSHEGRAALFGELRRALREDGRIVLVEHLRDMSNFLAFGPGFLHFHSRRTWLKAIASAGLAVERELSITPFVHVFIIRRTA